MKMDGDPFIFYFTFLKLINILIYRLMGTTLSGTNASMPFAGLRKEMRRNRNIKVGKYWKIQSSFKYTVSMGDIDFFFIHDISAKIYREFW